MYCPKPFQMPEADYPDFIANHPLATVVASAKELAITQCPLLYLPESHQLIGHLANNNPFLKQVANDAELTILFHGEQGYVSANWYEEQIMAANQENPSDKQPFVQVPTWNYSSLEVKGRVTIQDQQQTLTTLQQQSDFFETRVNEDWCLTKLSSELQQAMVKAITAFTVTINSWQGKQKLSQNKSTEIQQRLIKHMNKQSGSEYAPLIQQMQTIRPSE